MTDNQLKLAKLGFGFKSGGVHTARTMMFEELESLLEAVSDPAAPRSEYREAAVGQNCLAKKTDSNRKLTYSNLASLYSLEPSNVLFRALRYFW
ncbi:MAG: hypothetical protein LBQ12_06260, partial [Deltaproteobacteria bacterium]|nr:hypothetical protein [Deltaproteobacteria bacterium]